MRILIYGINYSPELTGVGKYTGELGAWLAQQNQEVDVITSMPYYPEWSIHNPYKQKWWFTEQIAGVRVHRCPFYVPKNVTPIKRILHEFSFMLSSLFYWIPIFFSKRYSSVICLSPPFHLGLIPLIYKYFRKVPIWCHIQDLQIDMAKELGMIQNKNFLKIMFQVETFILKRCTVVSTISEGMVRKVNKNKLVNSECLLFPNWVDDNYVKPLSQGESLRAELGIDDSTKVVLYSGSLGEKQGLEIIIEAAKSLSDRQDIIFLIFGSGGGKTRLEALVRDYNLTNVIFYSLQPYEKLSALLATADIHLVLQKKSASDLVLPSKLTGILAAGGCALVSAVPNSTLYEVINKYQIGILIEPESADALVFNITKAFSSDLAFYKKNARIYAESYLSKEAILKEFSNHLSKFSIKPERFN